MLHSLYLASKINHAPNAPYDKAYVDPKEIIKWAIENGINFPDDVKNILQANDETTNSADAEANNKGNVSSEKQSLYENLVVPIKTGNNIKWWNINITFIGEEEILVQFGKEACERKFNKAGFEDGRNGKPIKSWAGFAEQQLKMVKYHTGLKLGALLKRMFKH